MKTFALDVLAGALCAITAILVVIAFAVIG